MKGWIRKRRSDKLTGTLGRLVKLADTQDLGSCPARGAGSSPAAATHSVISSSVPRKNRLLSTSMFNSSDWHGIMIGAIVFATLRYQARRWNQPFYLSARNAELCRSKHGLA
jgi:hypothetical protein